MSRTVKPETIKTLREWTARWPKATNLGFDPESREPTIYAQDGSRTRVSSIPWRREGDTMTILTQPALFPAGAVAAARGRFAKVQQQRAQISTAGQEQMRIAEAAVLEAWQRYNAAPASGRAVLRRDILLAERQMRDVEAAMAPRDRVVAYVKDYITTYVPPFPTAQRGISLLEATGATGTTGEGTA
jgi:hypothetical protein